MSVFALHTKSCRVLYNCSSWVFIELDWSSPKTSFHHFEPGSDHLDSLLNQPSERVIISNVMKSADVCKMNWSCRPRVLVCSLVQMYFRYFIPLWQWIQYTALCTVLSFALAHFAKLDSVLWEKLLKIDMPILSSDFTSLNNFVLCFNRWHVGV